MTAEELAYYAFKGIIEELPETDRARVQKAVDDIKAIVSAANESEERPYGLLAVTLVALECAAK